MKKYLFLLLVFGSFGCTKEYCVSCGLANGGQNATYCGTLAECEALRDETLQLGRASGQEFICHIR